MRKKDKIHNIKKVNLLCEKIYLQNKGILEFDLQKNMTPPANPEADPEAGQDDIKTYGDIKRVINAIIKKQKWQKIKGVGIDVALGLLKLDKIKNAYDFFKAAANKQDTKKTKTWIDKLDVDDITSELLDDTVENSFIKYVTDMVYNKPDDEKVAQDFSMDQLLISWLSDKYEKRTVSIPPKA